jgi:hypothetical protein
VAGFIILSDGRAYAAANWAYDRTVEAIVESLPDTPAGQAIGDWLLQRRCTVKGPGLGSVDVRELTPANQELFLAAVEDAYAVQKDRGPDGWTSPDFWSGWIGRFADLVKMIQCVRDGEPPDQFNPHMTGIVPPSGRRDGPGWDET